MEIIQNKLMHGKTLALTESDRDTGGPEKLAALSNVGEDFSRVGS